MRTEIISVDGDNVEIRCLESPTGIGYRGWQMPIGEAMDLAKWWLSEGRHVCSTRLPVRVRSGSVLVTMNTLETIEVLGLDRQGRPKLKGCSLPRQAADYLPIWFSTPSATSCGAAAVGVDDGNPF